ncbi:MAG: hypothetical protein QF464_22155, partial [Myxococcota bacterium]|nr:hypothetical protein [Myxococcota bacterium]
MAQDATPADTDSAQTEPDVTADPPDAPAVVDTQDATGAGDTPVTPGDADTSGPDDAQADDAPTEPLEDGGDLDVSPSDALGPETVDEDGAAAGDDVAPSGPDVADETPPTVTFDSPAAESIHAVGSAVTLSALVDPGSEVMETLSWSLESNTDGPVANGTVPDNGFIEVSTSTLSPNWHVMTFTLSTPDAPDVVSASRTIGICATMSPDDFDADIESAGWKLYGDAYWDTNGWLELTGLQSGAGSIYKVSETLAAADATIQFDFYTGGGVNGGADGFAMTVIDLGNVAALENYIATAGNGGCLGYGVSETCGDMVVEAFHVEIDTFYNTGDPFYDPTSSNHIAVTLNGDPANHILLAANLSLEDEQWHTIEIVVSGEH